MGNQKLLIISMMRIFHLLLSCALCVACASPCKIVWTEGQPDSKNKKATHKMEIINAPKGTDWTIWFSQFRTPVKMEDGSPADILHLSGTMYRVAPLAQAGDTMRLVYEAKALVNQCRAPEGFYLQKKGEKPVPVDVKYIFLPAEEKHSFEYKPVAVNAYDIIPRLKSVVPAEGSTALADVAPVEPKLVDGQMPGWYRITIDGKVSIEAADQDGAYYASLTLDNIRRNAAGKAVPNAVVTDWPDMPYRGLMLDVSRNFTTKNNLLKLIDILAHYKVNFLHLHLGDDEGWRVEIDALPELTAYGAYRGIPVLNDDGSFTEPDALQLTYCTTPDRNDTATSGNGYYSHADFVEILKYAAEHHIKVIPEFDTPGHSRAAIKSMEVRAARTGDASCLLSEAADTSKYVSVQDYTDNAINVALPSTYKFIETVFDGIIALYKEAGVPLEAIHVGGDEVPDGAWLGSPACRKLMADNGWTDPTRLKDYFISKVLDIAINKGVKLAGWQEVAQHLEPETFNKLKANLFMINLWAVSRGRVEQAYTLANDGVPVVLSNASHNYFDMAYNNSKLERGHSWSGYVSEKTSFSFLPYAINCKTKLSAQGKRYLLGVQGQLWTETIRNFDHVTYYIFPKAAGLFERGWNAAPEWSGTEDEAFETDFDKFFSIIVQNEYPYYDSMGITYHKN